jgi:hypothetical protein
MKIQEDESQRGYYIFIKSSLTRRGSKQGKGKKIRKEREIAARSLDNKRFEGKELYRVRIHFTLG